MSYTGGGGGGGGGGPTNYSFKVGPNSSSTPSHFQSYHNLMGHYHSPMKFLPASSTINNDKWD